MILDPSQFLILLILGAAQAALIVGVALWMAGWIVRRREAGGDAHTPAARDTDEAVPSPDELLARLARLERELVVAEERVDAQLGQLKAQAAEARTDGLTGLPNRKALDEELDRRLAARVRHGRPLTMVLCDIDHFKAVNDRYGHQAGDVLLCELAALLRRELRETDFVARYGGEEFAFLLPETELGDALTLVERIRSTVEASRSEFAGTPLRLTVSQGVANAERTDSRESLLRRADVALYTAKAAGRNCTRYHDGAVCRTARLRPDGHAYVTGEDEILQAVGDEIRERLQEISQVTGGGQSLRPIVRSTN